MTAQILLPRHMHVQSSLLQAMCMYTCGQRLRVQSSRQGEQIEAKHAFKKFADASKVSQPSSSAKIAWNDHPVWAGEPNQLQFV